tara:strand:+ start:14297 stop:14398 length:102 start_codon:yes stop_codon:yes gene_type:complete
MEIILLLSIYIIGMATGLYAASQIEDHIKQNKK